MKDNILTLDIEEEELRLGLLRLSHSIPDYEFFFKVNKLNSFYFSRVKDFKIETQNYLHYHVRYQGYNASAKSTFSIIKNLSYRVEPCTTSVDLFSELRENTHLLPKYPDADYIILTKELFADFSLILLPENITFPLQNIILSPEEGLYKNIQYYE